MKFTFIRIWSLVFQPNPFRKNGQKNEINQYNHNKKSKQRFFLINPAKQKQKVAQEQRPAGSKNIILLWNLFESYVA